MTAGLALAARAVFQPGLKEGAECRPGFLPFG